MNQKEAEEYFSEFKRFAKSDEYRASVKMKRCLAREMARWTDFHFGLIIKDLIDFRRDDPLPRWANSIVRNSCGLSRKLVIALFDFHNRKIKQHRMLVAKGLASVPEDTDDGSTKIQFGHDSAFRVQMDRQEDDKADS